VVTPEAGEAAMRRAAGWLLDAGCVAGDRVVFCLPSSGVLLTAVLGALRVGIIPVLLNPALVPGERDALAVDAEPRLVVDDPGALARLDEGRPTDLAPLPLGRPMHYTSGTTGRAKGVWAGVWDEERARAVFDDEADLWGFGPGDVHLVCSPMAHSVSIRFAGGTLLRGGTCVVLSRFDADTAVGVLGGGAGPVPTTTFLAPTALHRLLAVHGGVASVGGLRLLVHAGSACPPALKRAVLDAANPGAVWEFLGSTEGQFTVCPPEDWLAHPGTVGRARPGRVVTADGDGTLWCRAPSFARFEYWRDPDKTAAAWRGDAFSVGDLGRVDGDGYVYLDGRRHDLIISGGLNVYPAEVEAALAGVAGIDEVAVFGLPDERWGEKVCAALVLEGRPTPAAVTDAVARARTAAGARLAGYKRPKAYAVVDALPHTPTGKLRRTEVAALVTRFATD
jgi:long-chain acyl-CoA synthetase